MLAVVKRVGWLPQQRAFQVKSEMVQERKIGSHARKIIGEDEKADDRHQAAAHDLHGAEMLLEASVEGQKLIQSDAGQKKRYAQAERIDRQQEHALTDALLLARD